MTMTIAKLDEMIRLTPPSYGVYFQTLVDVRGAFRDAVHQFGDQVAAQLWDRAEKVSRTTPLTMAKALRNEVDVFRLGQRIVVPHDKICPELLAVQQKRMERDEYVLGVDMAAEPVASKAAPSGIANMKIDRATRVYSNGEDPEKIVVEGHAHENGHMVNKTVEIDLQDKSRRGVIINRDGSLRAPTAEEAKRFNGGGFEHVWWEEEPKPKREVTGTVTVTILNPKAFRQLMGMDEPRGPTEQDRAVHGAIAAMTSAQANRRPNEL